MPAPLRSSAAYGSNLDSRYSVKESASERRKADLHLTAYPQVLNLDMLPEELSTSAKESQAARNQKSKNKTVNDSGFSNPFPMMTTNQLTAHLFQQGVKMREAVESKRSKRNLSLEAGELLPDDRPLVAVPGDQSVGGGGESQLDRDRREQTTYRMDFCHDEAPVFHDPSRHRPIPDHRKDWSKEDAINVDASVRNPYLTLPVSVLRNQPTMYRHDYLHDAMRDDYRLVSVKAPGVDLSSSYAYSGYGQTYPTSLNESVKGRKGNGSVKRGGTTDSGDFSSSRIRSGNTHLDALLDYDPEIAAVNDMHNLLDKTYTPRVEKEKQLLMELTADSSFAAKQSSSRRIGGGGGNTGKQLKSALYSSADSRKSQTNGNGASRGKEVKFAADSTGKKGSMDSQEEFVQKRNVILPGVKGSGYRLAPSSASGYISLPREHFCHQAVYDY